jgi:hypothetical protein
MPGLTELAYTTVGGLTGSLVTVIASQGKDRRAARAACHVRINQVFTLGAMTTNLNDESRRNEFDRALVELEAAALSAGLPYRLVDSYIVLRNDFYYSMAASQLPADRKFADEWDDYIDAMANLVARLEWRIKFLLWHPWKGRLWPGARRTTVKECERFFTHKYRIRADIRKFRGTAISWSVRLQNSGQLDKVEADNKNPRAWLSRVPSSHPLGSGAAGGGDGGALHD